MIVATEENEETGVTFVGDEDLRDEDLTYLYSLLGDDETPVAVADFDEESKSIVVTDLRVLILGEGGVLNVLNHDDIVRMSRDGRDLVIETAKGYEHRYGFDNEETIEELIQIANERQTDQASLEHESNESIAERVRFWEEQDKINQELIPRVIRQNELLTAHIAEHENLPEVAGRAISEALAKAREEQQGQYEAALDAAERKIAESTRATTQALADAREEQRGQYEAALDTAERTIAETTRATTQALVDAREEQRKQYETAIDAAHHELAQHVQTSLNQALGAMKQETSRTRNVLVAIAAGTVIVSVAALVVGVFA